MNFLRFERGGALWPTVLPALLLLTCHLSAGQTSRKSATAPPTIASGDRTRNDASADRLLGIDLRPKDPPSLPANDVIARLMSKSAGRSAQLRGYRTTRVYHVQYHGFLGAREATMQVASSFTAPDEHEFSVISESGSKLLINRVLLKLLDSEREAWKNQAQIEITPANYDFDSLGIEKQADGSALYVIGVRPRKDSRFLYRGKIWVTSDDFAVTRMEGQPARSPSFWIKDTQIDSTWEKIGSFWLIQHNSSVSHIRMGGSATLTIDYTDYQITGVGRTPGKSQNPALPDPSSVTPPR